ncbi:hypothetical protein [Aliikangiella sp. G2MR2-5]|uniref:hypothetical protein n=1 Tax=Aliikangiella sp. G2MR2-5 TaxID=2788943 RepID=UPI0018AC16B7|nr:hypothetical protein [Aliikangiella sp. G2MR2-5]
MAKDDNSNEVDIVEHNLALAGNIAYLMYDAEFENENYLLTEKLKLLLLLANAFQSVSSPECRALLGEGGAAFKVTGNGESVSQYSTLAHKVAFDLGCMFNFLDEKETDSHQNFSRNSFNKFSCAVRFSCLLALAERLSLLRIKNGVSSISMKRLLSISARCHAVECLLRDSIVCEQSSNENTNRKFCAKLSSLVGGLMLNSADENFILPALKLSLSDDCQGCLSESELTRFWLAGDLSRRVHQLLDFLLVNKDFELTAEELISTPFKASRVEKNYMLVADDIFDKDLVFAYFTKKLEICFNKTRSESILEFVKSDHFFDYSVNEFILATAL